MSDATHVYIGRAACGCIRAVSTDMPGATDLVARDVSNMVKGGLTVERMPIEEFRAQKMTRPDCAVHTASAPRQEALL